ncbi:protein ACCELERATED CELL DEATH 6 isoform X2 [Arachis duranensis]|uniref:Protein ACCELERATED CELL DEATH 6 isoform X2 n=1 Tax=Arachis duranensis TaxID=130453 RepID=A0A9C6TTC2_ARADU|nr:protein ACCELERATED CELL DEATH 6 isoform X2 [Arachis duranensis]
MEVEVVDWRQNCHERLEILKNKQFPIFQDVSASQDGMTLQQRLPEEVNILSFELYKAIENENADMFIDELEKVSARKKLPLSDIFEQVTLAGDSMLHVASDMGKGRITELILHHFPNLLNKRNIRGDTPLHVAARSNKNLRLVKVILTQYANDKSRYELEDELTRLTNEYGNTALHEAVYSKDPAVVTELLNADGAVINHSNKSGRLPLHLAIEIGNVKICRLLLKTPFPVNDSFHQCHPLHTVIIKRNLALIRIILANRPELISLRDEDGETALHFAAYVGFVECAQILLKSSALTGMEQNKKGNLPIHLACEKGRVEVVKELLQQEWPSPKVCLNQKGQNILHIAAKNGKANLLKYLLRNKKIEPFTINEKDKNGNTPLHLAAKNLFPEVLFVMTGDERVKLNYVNNDGLTALDIVWFHLSLRATPRELSYWTLRKSGASCSMRAYKLHRSRSESPQIGIKYDQQTVNIYLIVSTLLVTVTFSAAFSVPGGVYSSDDPNPHNRGMAVLANKKLFKMFTIFNTIAMYCSTIGSMMFLWERLGDDRVAQVAFDYAMLFMCFGVMSVALAFAFAVCLTVSNDSFLAIVITVLAISFISIIISMGVIAFYPYRVRNPLVRRVNRFLIWFSCKFCQYTDRPKKLDTRERNKDAEKNE